MMKVILSVLILFGFSAEGNRILKTKKHKALVLFKDAKVQQGSHFEILDLYGHLQGILRITHKHKKKAIGVLIAGNMKPKWTLEPTNNRQVLKLEALLNRDKNPASAKRGIASQKRAEKKKLRKQLKALKKQRGHLDEKISRIEKKLRKGRRLAQETEETYVVENDPFFSSPQLAPGANPVAPSPPPQDDISPALSSISAGLMYKPQYRLQKVNTNKGKTFQLTGFSYLEPRLFVEGIYRSKVSAQLNFGYSEFIMSESQKSCNQANCYLRLSYALAGLELKVKLWENDMLALQAGLQGNLMYTLNDISKESNYLKSESKGLHGDLGLVAGIDLNFGSLRVPIYGNVNVIVPPTKHVTFLSFGVGTGLAWQF